MTYRSENRVPGTGNPTRRHDTLPIDPLDATLTPLRHRYEISSLLGSGGMGKVYRARDRETNEIVAIKVLRPDIAADPAMSERFKNELRLARRITHKNVCRIYDFNRIGELVFITMEYVDGETLRAHLRRLAPLPLKTARDLMLQIGAGLKEAHAQGVVHRDLKPENIMIAGDAIKIMDFGIARSLQAHATTTSAFLGTPAYVAPEQAQGKPVDQRADIYALGLIFYECLTGRAAFSGDTPIEIALKQVNERPLAPRQLVAAVPAHIEAIILRCLEKDPARRFAAVEQLERALTTEAQPVPRATVTHAIATPPRRSHIGRWFVAVLLLAISAVIWQQQRVVVPTPVVERPAATVAAPPPVSPTTTPSPASPLETPSMPGAEPRNNNKPERAVLHQKLIAAAESGEPQAQYRLALLLASGPVAVRDDRKAADWMHRAAESGHADAQFALGKMYERGRGVARNPMTAKMWYERAAAAGHTEARAMLERAPVSRRPRANQ